MICLLTSQAVFQSDIGGLLEQVGTGKESLSFMKRRMRRLASQWASAARRLDDKLRNQWREQKRVSAREPTELRRRLRCGLDRKAPCFISIIRSCDVTPSVFWHERKNLDQSCERRPGRRLMSASLTVAGTAATFCWSNILLSYLQLLAANGCMRSNRHE